MVYQIAYFTSCGESKSSATLLMLHGPFFVVGWSVTCTVCCSFAKWKKGSRCRASGLIDPTLRDVVVMSNITCTTRVLLKLSLEPLLSDCWNKDSYHQVMPYVPYVVHVQFVVVIAVSHIKSILKISVVLAL